MSRDYAAEYSHRDRAALKRQRGRAYEREIARARAMGLSIKAMRRATRIASTRTQRSAIERRLKQENPTMPATDISPGIGLTTTRHTQGAHQ